MVKRAAEQIPEQQETSKRAVEEKAEQLGEWSKEPLNRYPSNP